jgi:prepilin-type N-terminal cleavage/methylation domain-containing protein
MRKYSKTSAFTLIEVLIVTAIVAMVSATISACLSAGIRAWEEAQRFGADERHALLAMEMIEKDIVNLLPFPDVGLSGVENQIVFATPPASFQLPAINIVKYFWDSDKKAVYRKQWRYPEDENPANQGELWIRNVNMFKIEYYDCSSGVDSSVSWKPEWNSRTNFPAAIRLMLAMGGSDKGIQLKRTIVLPAFSSRTIAGESVKRVIP